MSTGMSVSKLCYKSRYHWSTDLGFQAAQRVMSSSNESRLHTIKDLAQNLPMLARHVPRLCLFIVVVAHCISM